MVRAFFSSPLMLSVVGARTRSAHIFTNRLSLRCVFCSNLLQKKPTHNFRICNAHIISGFAVCDLYLYVGSHLQLYTIQLSHSSGIFSAVEILFVYQPLHHRIPIIRYCASLCITTQPKSTSLSTVAVNMRWRQWMMLS